MHRLLLTAVLATTIPLLQGCAAPAPLRVMTFNIRYAAADDGENGWDNRRELVLRVIRDCNPDVLGLQEVLASQGTELRAGLPDYAFVGVGREDGVERGEFVPIMYRQGRFELVNSGTFWLSETREQPGSVGWDAALPRTATWVRLRLREAPDCRVRVIAVHFDHRGALARAESARLLRDVAATAPEEPLILLGDFNCVPTSEPYRILLARDDGRPALNDAAQAIPLNEHGGTYHAFTGQPQEGRIDWILFSDAFRVQSAAIRRTSFDGRYPSDHFPVSAELALVPTPVGKPRLRPPE